MKIIIIIIIIIALVCFCLSLSGNSFYFFSHSPSVTIPSINKEEKTNQIKLDKTEINKLEIEHEKAVESDKLEINKAETEYEKAIESIYKAVIDKADAYKATIDKAESNKVLLREEIINYLKLENILLNQRKNIQAILNDTEPTMEESINKKNAINDFKKNTLEILDLHKKFREESLELNYNPPDMRILYDCSNKKSNLNIQPYDIIIAPNLFCDQNNFDIYKKLFEEMEQCGIDRNKLWKSNHGDRHIIADDNLNWSKKNVPTFNMIIDKISKFFNMDIKETRFNFYRNNNDWKPFHRDPADIKSDKEKKQNFTVGISFGSTREIAFEYAFEDLGHRRIISLPLPNGSTYCFTRDININWKHGVLPIDPNKNIPDKLGRISIIAWGFIDHL